MAQQRFATCRWIFKRVALVSFVTSGLAINSYAQDEFGMPESELASPIRAEARDEYAEAVFAAIDELETQSQAEVYLASLSLSQDTAAPQPQLQQPTTATLRGNNSDSLFRGGAPRSNLASVAPAAKRYASATDRVLGIEAKVRNSSDVGGLLGASANSSSVTNQKRNPIINDPRVRGNRVGQTNAAGSYWVPARIDLDTMLSKIDSNLIDEINVVKGPYAAQFGPGTEFLNFELKGTPRSESGTEYRGSSALNYQTNGDQWYGRQTFYIADENWGARVGYGHRTATDYQDGSGNYIPSSYNSRDFDLAIGFDVAPGRTLEMIYLRQDQTGVELAGQAFDIDSLVTNGVEVTWTDREVEWADRFIAEVWYNDTQVKGGAQTPAKRKTFPFLDIIRYVGTTRVDSQSTGTSFKSEWEIDTDQTLTAGADFRFVRQHLDEISSGRFGFNFFNNANSPIPASATANPGLFLEYKDSSVDDLRWTTGVRTDIVVAEMLDDASALQNVGTGSVTYASMLGTNDFDQSFGLWSTYLTAEYDLDENWMLTGGVGHGQRAPSLTELYAAESFMFLLQNGLNTVTGDPRLNPERRTQIDLGLKYEEERWRAGINGFYAWVNDRITFEAMSVRRGPPFGNVQQINLRYVNTDLATLSGFESNAEYDVAPWISVFSTVNYVEGTDETRNGDFATRQANGLNASQRVTGVRGALANAGVPLRSREALPGIAPLQARSGVRLNGMLQDVKWNVEFAARMVAEQDRVAASLLESSTPGYTVLDVRSHWLFNEHFSIVTGVENLTDKSYREHFDFRSQDGQSVRQPGLNFYFGSELTY